MSFCARPMVAAKTAVTPPMTDAGNVIISVEVENNSAAFVNLVNGVLLAGILWEVASATVLVVWLCALMGVTGARFMMLRAFRNAPQGARFRHDMWTHYFVVGACAAGFVWGAAGLLLFHPDSFPHQVFLAFVLGGMVAGAVPLLSSVERAYSCFAVPTVLPISAQMLAAGDHVHLIMGFLILVFGGGAEFFTLRTTSLDLSVRANALFGGDAVSATIQAAFGFHHYLIK